MQVALAPLPDSVQGLPAMLPWDWLVVTTTLPVGVVGLAEVSVTVAVQVVDWLTAGLAGSQLTDVDVAADAAGGV